MSVPTSRTVTDTGGRLWSCNQSELLPGISAEGRDVAVLCTTPSVSLPVQIVVGWQWLKMADNGLARLITAKAPVPRR